MIFVLYYFIGFMVTLTFLKLFGKKVGIDYDNHNEYHSYDDWDNNAQAYTFFSLMWFVVAPLYIIIMTFFLLYKFVEAFLKYPNL